MRSVRKEGRRARGERGDGGERLSEGGLQKTNSISGFGQEPSLRAERRDGPEVLFGWPALECRDQGGEGRMAG